MVQGIQGRDLCRTPWCTRMDGASGPAIPAFFLSFAYSRARRARTWFLLAYLLFLIVGLAGFGVLSSLLYTIEMQENRKPNQSVMLSGYVLLVIGVFASCFLLAFGGALGGYAETVNNETQSAVQSILSVYVFPITTTDSDNGSWCCANLRRDGRCQIKRRPRSLPSRLIQPMSSHHRRSSSPVLVLCCSIILLLPTAFIQNQQLERVDAADAPLSFPCLRQLAQSPPATTKKTTPAQGLGLSALWCHRIRSPMREKCSGRMSEMSPQFFECPILAGLMVRFT